MSWHPTPFSKEVCWPGSYAASRLICSVRLIFFGRLEDGRTMGDYNVQDGAEFYVSAMKGADFQDPAGNVGSVHLHFHQSLPAQPIAAVVPVAHRCTVEGIVH
jgi:ribosomal protein L35AE/L33A